MAPLSRLLVFLLLPCAASAAVLHVCPTSPNPAPPYSSWQTAARIAQDAIDLAQPNDIVLLTNGVYRTGGRLVYGNTSNRLAIDKPIEVRSVNGPEVTFIEGAPAANGGHGDGAIRCAYIGTNAVLSGVTLRFGFTCTNEVRGDRIGGGALLAPSGLITNCIVTDNSAFFAGGGICDGVVRNCIVQRNSANTGGGIFRSTVFQSLIRQNSAHQQGAGLDRCTATQCLITENYGTWYLPPYVGTFGGGAYSSRLLNCIISANRAYRAGAAQESDLTNCTVVANSATQEIGGVSGGVLHNCIVYYNDAPVAPNCKYSEAVATCTAISSSDIVHGFGVVTNPPAFVDFTNGDFRLRYDSPCIDAGAAIPANLTHDYSGLPRIADGNMDGSVRADLGAFEYHPASTDTNGDGIPDDWTIRFGLDPSEDQAAKFDHDRDGFTTGEEWIADTDPRDPASFHRIISLRKTPELAVSFMSSSNRLYTLRVATNAHQNAQSPDWRPLPNVHRLRGSGNVITALDTNVNSRAFYLLEVNLP